ncbi:RING finger protein, partial [Actinidia chinensis var. chinensis]
DKDANQFDPNHARFQRTDQWMPVYSWLESLDTDELIKSKDILDWLSENPEIREQLYSRHSRYHLMHYIKKCHVKILKRKEKKKGLKSTNKTNSVRVQKTGTTKLPVPLPCTTLNNLPKDSDIYIAKRNEAYHKYEILVELEKQLSTLFPKRENLNNLKES